MRWLGIESLGGSKQRKICNRAHRLMLSLTVAENTSVLCVAAVDDTSALPLERSVFETRLPELMGVTRI